MEKTFTEFALFSIVVFALVASMCAGSVAYAGPGAGVQKQKVAPTKANRLALLRISVSESGWLEVGDARGIHAVLIDVRRRIARRQALSIRRVAYATAAKAYSPRATGRKPPLSDRQAWVSGLNLECKSPKAFPADWAAYEALCFLQVALVDEILAGEIDNKCIVSPHHWGGDVDKERAKRGGFVEVDCGETLNTFYRYPTREEKRLQQLNI